MAGPWGAFAAREPVERPADRNVRRANLRRVFALFRHYRALLSVVCGLIVVSSALGVVSPFLLRAVLDTAIPNHRNGLLSALLSSLRRPVYQ